jgi:hypothetical protein
MCRTSPKGNDQPILVAMKGSRELDIEEIGSGFELTWCAEVV